LAAERHLLRNRYASLLFDGRSGVLMGSEMEFLCMSASGSEPAWS
jgi:hypothetical protein